MMSRGKVGLKATKVNKEHFSSGVHGPEITGITVTIMDGKELLASDTQTGKSDPVCFVWFGYPGMEPNWSNYQDPESDIQLTRTCPCTLEPEWNQALTFPLEITDVQSLLDLRCVIMVKDEDMSIAADGAESYSYDDLGQVVIEMKNFTGLKCVKNTILVPVNWYKLQECPGMSNASKITLKKEGRIRLKMTITILEQDAQNLLHNGDQNFESVDKCLQHLASAMTAPPPSNSLRKSGNGSQLLEGTSSRVSRRPSSANSRSRSNSPSSRQNSVSGAFVLPHALKRPVDALLRPQTAPGGRTTPLITLGEDDDYNWDGEGADTIPMSSMLPERKPGGIQTNEIFGHEFSLMEDRIRTANEHVDSALDDTGLIEPEILVAAPIPAADSTNKVKVDESDDIPFEFGQPLGGDAAVDDFNEPEHLNPDGAKGSSSELQARSGKELPSLIYKTEAPDGTQSASEKVDIIGVDAAVDETTGNRVAEPVVNLAEAKDLVEQAPTSRSALDQGNPRKEPDNWNGGLSAVQSSKEAVGQSEQVQGKPEIPLPTRSESIDKLKRIGVAEQGADDSPEINMPKGAGASNNQTGTKGISKVTDVSRTKESPVAGGEVVNEAGSNRIAAGNDSVRAGAAAAAAVIGIDDAMNAIAQGTGTSAIRALRELSWQRHEITGILEELTRVTKQGLRQLTNRIDEIETLVTEKAKGADTIGSKQQKSVSGKEEQLFLANPSGGGDMALPDDVNDNLLAGSDEMLYTRGGEKMPNGVVGGTEDKARGGSGPVSNQTYPAARKLRKVVKAESAINKLKQQVKQARAEAAAVANTGIGGSKTGTGGEGIQLLLRGPGGVINATKIADLPTQPIIHPDKPLPPGVNRSDLFLQPPPPVVNSEIEAPFAFQPDQLQFALPPEQTSIPSRSSPKKREKGIDWQGIEFYINQNELNIAAAQILDYGSFDDFNKYMSLCGPKLELYSPSMRNRVFECIALMLKQGIHEERCLIWCLALIRGNNYDFCASLTENVKAELSSALNVTSQDTSKRGLLASLLRSRLTKIER